MSIHVAKLSFTGTPGRKTALQDALEHLRVVEIEAPSKELAEHYANEIRGALERQAG